MRATKVKECRVCGCVIRESHDGTVTTHYADGRRPVPRRDDTCRDGGDHQLVVLGDFR